MIFLKEIVITILTIIAALITFFFVSQWWAPVAAIPATSFVLSAVLITANDRMDAGFADPKMKLAVDLLHHGLNAGFFVICLVLFGLHLDGWWSWLVGPAVWLLLHGTMTPRRWSDERATGRL